MDINDNQQVNSFFKGMNTDVSDAIISNEQYRYAENVRLVTNKDSNTGELHLIEGTSIYNNNSALHLATGETIKAFTSIRGYMIMVTSSNWIYKRDTSSNNSEWVLVFKPKSGDVFGDHFSIVTRWESENIVKLYIADGVNNLMYINIAPITAGHYIEGIDKLLSATSQLLTPIAEASLSTQNGTIKPGKVQYAYRYYIEGGVATNLSPLSKPVAIYKNDTEGYSGNETTTKSVILGGIPQSDTYSKIQIYRLSYVQIGQVPQVDLIYDGDIVSSYTDRGSSIEQSSLADFLSMLETKIKPTVIESKGDYLFAADVAYDQDETDSKFPQDVLRTYSSGDWVWDSQAEQYVTRPHNLQFEDENILKFNANYWYTTPNGSILGGIGHYLQWHYTQKYIIVDNKNRKWSKLYSNGTEVNIATHTINTTNTYTLGGQIFDQTPSLRSGEVYRYGGILYDDKGNKSSVRHIADIMIPNTFVPQAITLSDGSVVYKMCQWGIRFGVVFDNNIDDCAAIEIVRCVRTSEDKLTICQGLAGFPLSIYKRDESQNNTVTFNDSGYCCSPGLFTNNPIFVTSEHAKNEFRNSYAISNNRMLMFASPEYCYQPDDIKSIIDGKEVRIEYLYSGIMPTSEVADYSQLVETMANAFSDGPVAAESTVEAQSAYTKSLLDTTLAHPDKMRKIYSNDGDFNYSMTFSVRQLNTSTSPMFHNEEAGHDQFTYNREYPVTNFWTWDIINAAYDMSQTDGLFQTHGVKNTSIYFPSAGIAQRSYDQDVNTPQSIITNIGYSQTQAPDSFLNGNVCSFKDHISVVGNKQFVNWSTPLMMTIPDDKISDAVTNSIYSSNDWRKFKFIQQNAPMLYPAGSVGICMLLDLGDYAFVSSGNASQLEVPVINIKTKQSPYGLDFDASQTRTYVGFGNYMLYDSTTTTSIDVYDGDCYPGVFVYNASHAWYEPNTPYGIRQCGIYAIPVESDIDLSATHGSLVTRLSPTLDRYYVQDEPCAIDNYVQSKKAYQYNTAYGEAIPAMQYYTTVQSEIDSNRYDTRVCYSEKKTNGEHVDNWLNFKAGSYLDVDSRFGKITGLKVFKNDLLCWQRNATGILASNERVMINDADTNQIILGTGAVLQRHDYISTVYGKGEFDYEADATSNSTIYWWDSYNREILAYAGGLELIPLTKVKSVSNYINDNQNVIHPVLMYDLKYNELLASVVNNETLVYNEQISAFTSIYKFKPEFDTQIDNTLYVTSPTAIYKWNVGNGTNSTLFGTNANPLIRYIVNKNSTYVKVFDITTFGGRFYGGSNVLNSNNNAKHLVASEHSNSPLASLSFDFKTPLKQHSEGTGNNLITNREYDFRLNIPRNNDDSYGGRMRGKTMQCELKSNSNSTDFSLQYVITKFRMSWS